MTYDQVTQAVDNGFLVYWLNDGYQVTKDNLGRYLVIYTSSDYTTPLLAGDCVDCFITYAPKRFCTLLADETRPMKIWSIIRDFGGILIVENEGEKMAVQSSEIWRLT